MNTLQNFNNAMAYIEKHLAGTLSTEKLAQHAGCSEYHFRRLFSYLAGMPLGEYIRCRRLAEAPRLLRSGKTVTECALLLGYESADTFSKAFRAMHGVAPSKANDPAIPLKAFPPMSFRLTIQGGSKMEYRITQNGPFQIVGLKKRITLQFEGQNPQMAALYAKLTPARITELKALCNTAPEGMLSVSANFAERTVEGTTLDQYIGVATTLPAPSGYDVLHVEPSEWAVFSVVGLFPQEVQTTWARIYTEWLPASGYQLTGGPELLWHESPELSGPACKSELWVPVIKL